MSWEIFPFVTFFSFFQSIFFFLIAQICFFLLETSSLNSHWIDKRTKQKTTTTTSTCNNRKESTCCPFRIVWSDFCHSFSTRIPSNIFLCDANRFHGFFLYKLFSWSGILSQLNYRREIFMKDLCNCQFFFSYILCPFSSSTLEKGS